MASKKIETNKEANTRQYVENLIIVWLDVALNTNIHAAQTIKQLQVISNDIEVFNDTDTCIDYITNLKTEHVLFIVSNSVNLSILTLTQDLPVISVLYLLGLSNNDIQKKWLESIRKVKGVYTDINDLIKQIKADLRRIEHELIGLEFLETSDNSLSISRNPNKQEYTFMHSQLLKNVFLKFQDNSTAELVDYCRTVYADNPSQLTMIDEFECDYEANKAIWWYTRESFLYKLINKALRTQHVETLYSMRTFIRHLHEQLLQLSPVIGQDLHTATLTLYRGQKMSIREFEKLKTKEGGLLSVSNFLSTSANRELAYIYAGEPDEETVAMVFELKVDLNHNTHSSFACIEKFSHFGEGEHEWLFSMGSVFRIQKIELLDEIWHIHLTLTTDQDETLEKLTIHMSKLIQMERPNPLVPLCRLFARMDHYKKAVELCEKHTKSENGWEMKATLYDTLALMQVEKDDNNLALHYHQQALDIVVKHVDTNDPLLASYHNNVAISCDAVGQNKRAIEHYRIAITLELSAPQPDYTNIAYSYESMGNILYYCFKKYDEAMNCYEHSLELMLVYLPATHPDISSVYDSMAEIYEQQNELDKALDILYKSLDTIQKRPESEPRELANTYERIAEIYNKQKKFEEAAIMFNKCHELKVAHPSSVDFQLGNIDIDAVFAKLFRPDNDS